MIEERISDDAQKELEKASTAQNINILWVEDDEFLGDLITKKLSNNNFTVMHEATGEDALRRLETDKPDVALVDILLPEMDGFELVTQMKARDDMKNIPVIFFTNLATKEDIEKGYSIGADRFLVKSNMIPDEIIGEIHALLKEKGKTE